jgi:hypothetical protein
LVKDDLVEAHPQAMQLVVEVGAQAASCSQLRSVLLMSHWQVSVLERHAALLGEGFLILAVDVSTTAAALE